jgi:hypothetical protein
LQVKVAAIDRLGILPAVIRGDLLSGGDEGFDGLVAMDDRAVVATDRTEASRRSGANDLPARPQAGARSSSCKSFSSSQR